MFGNMGKQVVNKVMLSSAMQSMYVKCYEEGAEDQKNGNYNVHNFKKRLKELLKGVA